jgi:protein-L-isoaspartate(D-aspartate) O-methyltransferase
VIVLEGATEVEPDGLYGQLKMDGRLTGVFVKTQPPKACLVTHSPNDFGIRVLFDASAPVLPGLSKVPAFSF